MTIFRIALAIFGLGLATYTSFVVVEHGWNFVPFYLADLERMGWPGQFDLDFTILIILAALWIAWRSHFSAIGIVLALLTIPFVSMLLTAYLLYLSWRERGDVVRMLVGDRLARTDQ